MNSRAVTVAVTLLVVAAVTFLLVRSGDDDDPSAHRPGLAVDAPIPADSADAAGAADDDVIGDSGVTPGLLDTPVGDGPSGDAVGLVGYERAAADFALALYTWSYEQPEADRVAELERFTTGAARIQLYALKDSWDELDGARTTSQQVASATLSYVEPEHPVQGRAVVRVEVTGERSDLYFGETVHSHIVEVSVARHGDDLLVESYRTSR